MTHPLLQEQYVQVNGLRLFYRCDPSSAPPGRIPLVLVHGLGVSSDYMLPLARRLLADFPIYAPDLPGYGRSQHPDHVFRLAELAHSLIEWMDVVGLKRVHLLGNSMGCQIIVQAVLHDPARVEKIILDSPTMDPHHGQIAGQLIHAAYGLWFEPISLFPVLFRNYFSAGPLEVFKAMHDALQDPMQEDLPHVPNPTLVVRGSSDRIVTQSWVEEVTRLLPDGFLKVIPGGAHAANFDSPDALAQLVRDFLK